MLRQIKTIKKNLFSVSLMVSFFVHALVFGGLSLSRLSRRDSAKPFKSIEVTYQDLKSQKKAQKKKSFDDLKIVKDSRSYQDQKVRVLDKKSNMFSAVGNRIKDLSKLTGKLRMSDKKTQKIATLDIGKKITLSPLKAEKITNPKYLTYNDDMRQAISRNIKERAYTYVNHPDFEAGEVYLTFVLASSGLLKQVKIIEGKTFANDYLRKVALRSIKESNPFSPFPKGFDYPEFTFNLMISFQN